MKLAVTIDVEEEGLFLKSHVKGPYQANNVKDLKILDPVFTDLEIHPTLLVSYQAARHKEHRDSIAGLSEKWGGEIGLHLHPWNTPPFKGLPNEGLVPSEQMPIELLSAKLESLLDVLQDIAPTITSFRMGRFNMGPKMFSVLEQTRIKVDSSIAPMRRDYAGPDHLSAPVEPFFPDSSNPSVPGDSSILEVPLTIIPIFPRLNAFLIGGSAGKLLPASAVSWLFKYLFSLPAQPMYVGIKRLKAAVLLHRIRGGSILTTHFHSSELMPGGCPAHPTGRHIESFLKRLQGFLTWLRSEMNSESVTLSGLYDLYYT